MTTIERRRDVTVLLVDDDDPNREAMERALEYAGFDVLTAGTGADAVDLARRRDPDVVVLDVVLPDAGGLGVAREVRRAHPGRAVPILFITGLAPPAVRDALAPAPVLFKPFSRQELVSRVRELARAR
jgi:DNA-binding response OmpR family regulator